MKLLSYSVYVSKTGGTPKIFRDIPGRKVSQETVKEEKNDRRVSVDPELMKALRKQFKI